MLLSCNYVLYFRIPNLYSLDVYKVKNVYQKTKQELDFERLFSDPKAARGLTVAMFLRQARKPARLRIERIIELLKERARLIESAPESLPDWKMIVESSEAAILTESDSPVFQLNNEIDKLLARYKPPRLRMEMPTRSLERLRTDSHNRTREAEVALALKTMADDGLKVLDRLRMCRGCGEWLYATRADQVNCDADCRHIRYAQSDFYKVRARLQSKIKYWSDKRRLAVSLAARTKANEKLQTAKAELDKMKGEGK